MRTKMKKRICFILLLCMLVSMTGCGEVYEESISNMVQLSGQTAAVNTRVDPVKLAGRGLSAELSYGLNGYVKNNRYMNISARIQNHGEAFNGTLQVIMPIVNENCMYKKSFSVKTAENVEIDMAIPTCMSSNQLYVSINDAEGEEICARVLKVNMVYATDTIYIGLYSRHPKRYGYLEGRHSQLFELTKSQLNGDYKALDLLDVIVISDADASELTVEQRKGILSWVSRGGTLVLADSGREKEMKAFGSKLPYWVKLGRKTRKTTFGLTLSDMSQIEQRIINDAKAKKISAVQAFLKRSLPANVYDTWEYEISDLAEDNSFLDVGQDVYNALLEKYTAEELGDKLSLELSRKEMEKALSHIRLDSVTKKISTIHLRDSEVIISEEEPLLQKTSKGLGSVVMAGCSLGLSKKEWKVLGAELTEKITNNISEQRRQQLSLEKQQLTQGENYLYQDGLQYNETDSLPNLKLYGGILIVYILMIGPGFYLVCRKKKRIELLWGLIPVTAITFSILIYLIGTSTRVQKPYINYLTQVQLKENEQAVVTTRMRLVSSDNKPYTVELNGNLDIEPLDVDNGYAIETSNRFAREEDRKYKFGIEYSAKNTKLIMNSLSSLEGKNMKEEDVVKPSGDIEADVISEDMKLKGIVKNALSYDLEDCFLYDNGTVYYLGDIKRNQSVSLEDVSDGHIYYPSEYDGDADTLFRKMLGNSLYNGNKQNGNSSVEMKRRLTLAEAYLQGNASANVFVYGFAAEHESIHNNFLDKFTYDKYGVTGYVKEVNITYQYKGMEMIPDISQYAIAFDNEATDGAYIKPSADDSIVVSYQLPDGYEWKRLLYNKRNNSSYSEIDSVPFSGTVSLYDLEKGEEKQIINSNAQAETEIKKSFINLDGSLTLVYHLNTSDSQQMQLPVIMAAVKKK